MPGRRQGRGAAEPEPPWNGRGEEPTRRPRGFQKAVRTGAGTAACHAAPTPPPATGLRRPGPDWLTDMLPPAPGHDVRARSPGEGRGWQPRVSQRGAGPLPWRGGARRAVRGPRRPRCPAPLCRASGLTSWPGHPASRGGRLVPAAVLSGGEPACFASGEQKLAGDPRPRGFFRAIECLPWPHSLLSLFDARSKLEASGVGGGGLTSRVRSLIWSLRGPLIQYPACLRTGAATPA